MGAPECVAVHALAGAATDAARLDTFLSPRQPGVFAVGLDDGTMYIARGSSSRSCKRVPTEVKSEVVDLQWDPLSDDYLIVVFKNGVKELWDMNRLARVNAYEKQVRTAEEPCRAPALLSPLPRGLRALRRARE